MENVFLVIAIVLALVVFLVIQTIGKIKRARQAGKKLSKRNLYYAMVTKLFVKDLPD